MQKKKIISIREKKLHIHTNSSEAINKFVNTCEKINLQGRVRWRKRVTNRKREKRNDLDSIDVCIPFNITSSENN